MLKKLKIRLTKSKLPGIKILMIIIILIFSLNLIFTVLHNSQVLFTQTPHQSSISISHQNESITQNSFHNSAKNTGIYLFDNSEIAYKLLLYLDHFERLPVVIEKKLNRKPIGIKRNIKYCDMVRDEFVKNASYLFLEKNFITDYMPTELLRKIVIPSIGRDLDLKMTHKTQKKIHFILPTEVTLFYMHFALHNHYYIGKHYGCINQLSNHIYDHTIFNKKSSTAQAYQNYLDTYTKRPTKCKPEFMPQAYELANRTQCLQFFHYIQMEEYVEEKKNMGIIFFFKISEGVHQGNGVTIFDSKLENKLKMQYNYGLSCGKIKDPVQMQRYVPNLLLLDGHKFDLRVYLLVASTNPLIAYYHNGFLKLSVHIFDAKSSNKDAHISNTHIANTAFKEAREHSWLNMNETELRAFQTWTFDRLNNYLLDKGYIHDENWIKDSLIKQLKEIMIHSLRMSQHVFLKKSQTFELFGCDFVLDKDLKVWLIEINTTPAIFATTEAREKILIRLLTDLFELMHGYLRSRMKRVIVFINELSRNNGEGFLKANITNLKNQFDELNTNYLEPEFTPSRENGFQKIIDENLYGTSRYLNIIKKECL